MEVYAPTTKPISMAVMNNLIVTPPNSRGADITLHKDEIKAGVVHDFFHIILAVCRDGCSIVACAFRVTAE